MVLQVKFDNGSKGFTNLGDHFSLVEKEVSPDEFKDVSEKEFGKQESRLSQSCYGFIHYNYGSRVQPLYEGFENVILSDRGEVFRDLSLR